VLLQHTDIQSSLESSRHSDSALTMSDLATSGSPNRASAPGSLFAYRAHSVGELDSSGIRRSSDMSAASLKNSKIPRSKSPTARLVSLNAYVAF
jgi:hypothetical protein